MARGTRLEIEDGVARIAMDDGKVNAMSAQLLGEIVEGLDAAEKEGALVVLSGREGIFSAGFDLKSMGSPSAALEMIRAGVRAIQRILAFPRPVVTVCNGHAYPMGAFLMLAADVRFATRGAWRIGMNETAIGLTVPSFALELARHRLTAHGFARISTAPLFAPDEALRLGYLDRVVASDEIDDVVEEELVRLAGLDASSFAATKARINESAIAAVGRAFDEEFASLAAAGQDGHAPTDGSPE